MKRALVIAWCLAAFPLGLYMGLPATPRKATPPIVTGQSERITPVAAERPCLAAEWEGWAQGVFDTFVYSKDPESLMVLWEMAIERSTQPAPKIPGFIAPPRRPPALPRRQDSWGVWRPTDEVPELPKGVTGGAVVKVRGVNYYRVAGWWVRDDGLAAYDDSGRVEYMR